MIDTQELASLRLRGVVDACPDAEAIVFPDMIITYDQLWRLTEAFALRLRGHDVTAESTIHVDSADPATVLPALLATSLIGARFLQNVGSLNQPGLPFVSHAFFGPDAQPEGSEIAIDADWSPHRVLNDLGPWPTNVPPPDPDAPWLIVYTSGTTGVPKFVPLSQKMVCRRSKAVADEFHAGRTRFVSLYPYDSRPFLARALAAFLNGATLVVAADAPESWSRLGVDRVVGSPAAVAGRLAGKPLPTRIATLEIAGAPVPTGEMATLLESFDTVDDTYGATETNKSWSTLWTLAEDGSPVSRPIMRDSQIEIVDETGIAVPPGVEGRVRVRNDYLASGYLDNPAATQAAFRDGWFYPGDRAHWGEAGRLILSHRGDDVLNFGGAKLGLSQIDRVLAADAGIRDAACFRSPKPGADKTLIAFIMLADGVNAIQVAARAQKRCADILGQHFTPARLWPIAAIPRKPDGQPDREACRAMILDGMRRREMEGGARDPAPPT